MPDAPEPDGPTWLGGVDGKEEEAEPGLVRTGGRGNGLLGVAGANDSHLCGVRPALDREFIFSLSASHFSALNYDTTPSWRVDFHHSSLTSIQFLSFLYKSVFEITI